MAGGNCCCVPHCRTRRRNSTNEKVTLHAVPKDPKRRKLWVKAIALKQPRNLNVAKVCYKHFLKEDYLVNIVSGKRILRDNVVPSVFANRPTTSTAESQASPEWTDWAVKSPHPSPKRKADSTDPRDTDATANDHRPILDLHSYASNFIGMLRNGRATRSGHSQHEVSTTNSNSEPRNVADTNSGRRHGEDEPFEDLHTYSETLLSTLRNSAAAHQGGLLCGDVTDDDKPSPERNQESSHGGDTSPKQQDSSTSSYWWQEDTADYNTHRDVATSPYQLYKVTTNEKAVQCVEETALYDASSDGSDGESHREEEVGQLDRIQQKLQYTTHKVAWLRGALANRDKQMQELRQECLGLRKEAVELRQRLWLFEAQERYRSKDSTAASKPGALGSMPACPKCRSCV